MTFIQAKIHLDSETISEQLLTARQDKSIKLEKAARETKINIKYLDALEKGRFELLPKGVYGQNYLRQYAQYLRLDSGHLVELFLAEVKIGQKIKERELFNTQVIKRHLFLSFPKIIKGIIIFLLVVLVGAYLFTRLEGLIAPPRLDIVTPQDNAMTNQGTINLAGQTEVETQVMVNGEQLISDAYGNFSKQLSLKKGINFITITAQKKYGRERTEIRRVLRSN